MKKCVVSAVVTVVTCGYFATSVCFVIFCCRQIHTNYVVTWAMMVERKRYEIIRERVGVRSQHGS